jgi:hypothetical protein
VGRGEPDPASDLEKFRSDRRYILRGIHGDCDHCEEDGIKRGRYIKNPEPSCLLYEKIKDCWFKYDPDREEGVEATDDNPERARY